MAEPGFRPKKKREGKIRNNFGSPHSHIDPSFITKTTNPEIIRNYQDYIGEEFEIKGQEGRKYIFHSVHGDIQGNFGSTITGKSRIFALSDIIFPKQEEDNTNE